VVKIATCAIVEKFVSRLSRFFVLNPLNLLNLLTEKCVIQKAIAQVEKLS